MKTVILVEVELHDADAVDIRQGRRDYRTAIMSSVKDGHFVVISVTEIDTELEE